MKLTKKDWKSKNKIIKNLSNEKTIEVKPGYDYNYLGENGLIKENTEMDDKKILIGMVNYSDLDSENVQIHLYIQKRTTWLC